MFFDYDKKQKSYDLPGFNAKGNPFVLKKIRPGSKVLDLGCSTGNLGIGLKEKGCKVWGIEISEEAVKKAEKKMHKVERADLETITKLPFKEKFDYIVFADILEHLRNPKHILNISKKHLNKKGRVIISIPNIAFVLIRLKLLFGRFNYSDSGILDNTHVRFYTLKSFKEFLMNNGLKIISVEGFPLTIRRFTFITYPVTQTFKSLLARQFIIEAKL